MSLDLLTNQPGQSSTGSSPPRRRRVMTWLFPLGLLFGFFTILAILFGDRFLPTKKVHSATVVTIRSGESAGGSRDEKVLLFQASGWVEPDPYTTFVPTLIDGVVDQVHVLEGQSVKKGDLLATLIGDDARLDLQSAEQNLKSLEKKIIAHCIGLEVNAAEVQTSRRKIEAAEADLADARDTLTRLQKLTSGAVSKRELTQARLAVERQAAKVEEARTMVPQLEAKRSQIMAEEAAMEATRDELETARDRAKLAFSRTKIHSPIDGIVLHLHAAPGKKRMLGMDDPKSAVMVELYEPGKLQARIDVPLNEAAALAQGQPVEFNSELLPERVFRGMVTRIEGEADLQRNTLQAKVRIEDPDPRLRPGMLMRAKFFPPAKEKTDPDDSANPSSGRLTLFVPAEAVIGDSKVWVIDQEGRAKLKNVTVGSAERDGYRPVRDGLLSGEQVILPPHEDLSDGDRVEITSSTP